MPDVIHWRHYVRETLQTIVSAAASDGRRQPNRAVRARRSRRDDRAARARARRAAHGSESAREALDAATFKAEILEKSYAKQLAEARDKRAALEIELQEKDEILAGLGGGHEHTLRELNDALTVIKVLKNERDQLRKQIAEGGFRQPNEGARVARRLPPDSDASARGGHRRRHERRHDQCADRERGLGREETAGVGARPLECAGRDQEAPHEEMIAPDLVFTAKDKEKDDER